MSKLTSKQIKKLIVSSLTDEDVEVIQGMIDEPIGELYIYCNDAIDVRKEKAWTRSSKKKITDGFERIFACNLVDACRVITNKEDTEIISMKFGYLHDRSEFIFAVYTIERAWGPVAHACITLKKLFEEKNITDDMSRADFYLPPGVEREMESVYSCDGKDEQTLRSELIAWGFIESHELKQVVTENEIKSAFAFKANVNNIYL